MALPDGVVGLPSVAWFRIGDFGGGFFMPSSLTGPTTRTLTTRWSRSATVVVLAWTEKKEDVMAVPSGGVDLGSFGQLEGRSQGCRLY